MKPHTGTDILNRRRYFNEKILITVTIMIMAITLSGCGKNKSERLNERELEIEQKYGIEIEKCREEDLKVIDDYLQNCLMVLLKN